MIKKLAINRYRAIFDFQDKIIDNIAAINTAAPMISRKSETSSKISVVSMFLETIKLEYITSSKIAPKKMLITQTYNPVKNEVTFSIA